MKLIAPMMCSFWLVVAPHAGAWIETEVNPPVATVVFGRPPRGGVD